MAVSTARVEVLGDSTSLQRALREAEASIARTTAALSAAGVKMGDSMAAADTRIATSAELSAKKVEASHAKAIASMKKTNSEFAKWGTVTAAAVVGGSVDMAVHFESASNAIAKAAGTSSAAAGRITTAFKDLSGLEYSADKVSAAFATIAGEMRTVEGHALGVKQSVQVMTAALDLTDATGGDLTKTTEALGKILLTFGIRAEGAAGAADVLFNAAKQTGTEVEALSQVLARMHGRLGVLSPSLSEVGGLMEDLAKHGIFGRQSLSTLNGVFSTLISGGKKVEGMLKTLGVHVFDSKGHFVGLRSVIEQLNPALAKYTQQSQLAATRVLFGAGANRQLLSIIHEGPAALDKATSAVARHGTAAAAAAKEHQTLEGRFRIAKAEAKNLAASLGEVLIPALTKVVHGLTVGVEWLKKHHDAARALAIVIGTVLGAAVLDFAVSKVAKFVGGIKSMVDVTKTLIAKLGLAGAASTEAAVATEAASARMGGAFLRVLGPIGLLVGAVLAFKPQLDELAEQIEKVLGKGENLNQMANKFGGQVSGLEKTLNQQANPNQRTDHRGVRGEPINVLTGGGLSPIAAAGALGNFANEGKATDTGAEGLGIAQWIGPRRTAAEAFLRSKHEAVTSEHGQLEFVLKEIREQGLMSRLNAAKSPREAAALFMNLFEHPKAGPTAHQERREQSAADAYGSRSLPTAAAKAKKPKVVAGPSASSIDRWAEQSVGKFAESWGKNTGPELDKLQKEFHTKAAAWCAEFATTAAMMGGANKAVRTASVETIRQWATEGSHGYKKGISHTPHVGDLMLFGGHHTGFVQAVHGSQVTTIEGNTSAGKVARLTRNVSEGDFATPIYSKAGAGSVERSQLGKGFAVQGLTLSPQQMATVLSLTAAGAGAHSQAARFAGFASEAGEGWQHTRGLQMARRKPLSTSQGAREQGNIASQDVETQSALKLFYQNEVRELKVEVKAWGKLRKQYLSFARHAHGGAKKEALTKAAELQGKIGEAASQIKTLGGNITDTETAIVEGQKALEQLPVEATEAVNQRIAEELRAGHITPQQARDARVANIDAALANPSLSAEARLKLEGDRQETLKENTNAIEALTQATVDNTKALLEREQTRAGISEVEVGTLLKAIADSVSGQIGGRPQAYNASQGPRFDPAVRY